MDPHKKCKARLNDGASVETRPPNKNAAPDERRASVAAIWWLTHALLAAER